MNTINYLRMTKRFIPIGIFIHFIVYQSAYRIEPKAPTITFLIAPTRVCLRPLYQDLLIQELSCFGDGKYTRYYKFIFVC